MTEIKLNELPVRIALHHWNSYNERVLKLLEGLTDEQFGAPVAPNANTASWILGHLAEIHDSMRPLLGIGEKLHPELGEIYLHKKVASGKPHLSKKELAIVWQDIQSSLQKAFDHYTVSDWLARHEAVSEADFGREPHRNKLNVLIARTNHLSYHVGQLVLLTKNKPYP